MFLIKTRLIKSLSGFILFSVLGLSSSTTFSRTGETTYVCGDLFSPDIIALEIAITPAEMLKADLNEEVVLQINAKLPDWITFEQIPDIDRLPRRWRLSIAKEILRRAASVHLNSYELQLLISTTDADETSPTASFQDVLMSVARTGFYGAYLLHELWPLANNYFELRKMLNLSLIAMDNVWMNRSVTDVASFGDLHLLFNVPLAAIPASMKSNIENRWSIQETIRSDTPLTSDNILSSDGEPRLSGCCRVMWDSNTHLLDGVLQGHFQSGGTAQTEKGLIVKVDGEVIGVLKREGEPSLLALRNVLDFDGKLILALGGVYRLDESTFEVLRKSKVEVSGTGWSKAEIDQLHVSPASFLLNDAGIASGRVPLFMISSTIASQASPLDYPGTMIDLVDPNRISPFTLDRKQIWIKIVRALIQTRVELERSLGQLH